MKTILYLDLQVDKFENKNFSSNYVVVTLQITAPYIQNELDIYLNPCPERMLINPTSKRGYKY